MVVSSRDDPRSIVVLAPTSTGWNGSFNGGTADNVHQGPYAYGALAALVAQILMQ